MRTITRKSAPNKPLHFLRIVLSGLKRGIRGTRSGCPTLFPRPYTTLPILIGLLCRQSETERRLQEPNVSQEKRDQIWLTTGRKEGQYLRFLRTKDKPENYQTIKVIGRGAFGEVKLVQKKANGQVYAMKSLIKTEMLQRDQLAHVRSERDILAEAESPWVVKLFTTFQDAYFLYMLMEYLPGGDLMAMLIKYEIFSEDITRFYMAECILAIEAVHKLGFIHRYATPPDLPVCH